MWAAQAFTLDQGFVVGLRSFTGDSEAFYQTYKIRITGSGCTVTSQDNLIIYRGTLPWQAGVTRGSSGGVKVDIPWALPLGDKPTIKMPVFDPQTHWELTQCVINYLGPQYISLSWYNYESGYAAGREGANCFISAGVYALEDYGK